MELIKNPHGIMFHHFHNDKHIKCQGSLSADDLDKMIEFYKKYYSVISASEFYEKYQNKTLNDNEVCLTFDDALLCQYEVAYPVLKKHGLNAFWFIYTSPLLGEYEKLEIFHHFRFYAYSDIDEFYEAFFKLVEENCDEWFGIKSGELLDGFDPVEYKKKSTFYTYNDKKFRYIRDEVLGAKNYYFCMEALMKAENYDVTRWGDMLWMKKEHLKQLRDDGNIIGLHTHTHPTTLSKMTYQQQFDEYNTCKQILEPIIGTTVKTVSYPCNSFNDDTKRIMDELGVDLGFTATRYDSNGKLFIPREDSTNVMKAM